MKITKHTLLAVLALSLSPVYGEAKHDHDHDHDHKHEETEVKTPNKGRLLKGIEPHAELLITEENKVQITFFDNDGKTIAPTTQSFTLIAGERATPTKLTFVQEGDVFLSEQTLPEGKNYPAVLTFKADPEAKSQRLKFQLDLSECPTCDVLEYACTCAH